MVSSRWGRVRAPCYPAPPAQTRSPGAGTCRVRARARRHARRTAGRSAARSARGSNPARAPPHAGRAWTVMPANTRPVHAPTEVLTLLKGAARAPITPATPMYVPVPLPPPAPSADAPGSALAAMLVCTLDGQVVAVNDPALAMFGADAAEFAARPLDGWLSLRPELADLGATDARRPRDVHLAGRRSNGVPFPVRGHVRLVDAGGERRAVCTLRELDTHELVGVAQRFFDAGFDGAPIGMALFNSDGRYVRVNAELCRTLGRS